ncbi:MAG: DNA repair protein RadA [Candidatus Omnitrophica bacterium CG07_land_8_20_14_0_80_42_15]|uniref:DNA repair protein RadA n=1 Tax=Candidatus Aquitaenariimonas noxiae TaxID=1974741 RepID=A0A2J0KUG3_9BACT|nr:MAG: DNA repair protein RadA [Candidatus Omnitrophica bacterium CG07_land_8_20_14_0_80_42_15]
MTKTKSIFICQTCGYKSVKWAGKCPDCNEWNTIAEELESDRPASQTFPIFDEIKTSEPKPLSEIGAEEAARVKTGINEFDRILGGGLVGGSAVLIGGSPGIGKSTLLLQISNFLADSGVKVLYVSGEESTSQTKLRAERIGTRSSNLYIVNETNIELIMEYIKKLSPQTVIIDSIQVLFRPDISSSPGSVSQVRECGSALVFLAKKMNISVFMIGHVTKEGVLAGPRLLEHMVDTVLYFEGESHTSFRILRAFKNRFGSTNEIGVFEMTTNGLVEIANPSSIFLNERPKSVSGSVVVPTIEGSRPILVEIQALVTPTSLTVPRRQAQGLDYNRVSLLAAVLEKRLGFNLKTCDVFVNVAGGIRVNEPAVDLGISLAIISNLKEKPVQASDVIIGEIGLGGEVRGVTQLGTRLNEVARLGFKRAVVPKINLKDSSRKSPIEVIGVSTVKEAVDIML